MKGNFLHDLFLAPSLKFVRHILLHLFLIAIAVGEFVPVLFREDVSFSESSTIILLFYIALSSMVYLSIYVFLPLILFKKPIWIYILLFLAFVIFFVFVTESIESLIPSRSIPLQINLFWIILCSIAALLITLSLLGIPSMYMILKYVSVCVQRVNELKYTASRAELNRLKEQVSPHFLFNMLNNANVLIHKDLSEASFILFRLEDLLKYQISCCASEKVLLLSEINFLNDYLKLEKLRRDRLEYSLNKEGDFTEISVFPYLFIPFVGNAVKHSYDPYGDAHVNVLFQVDSTRIHFVCENSKPEKVRIANESVGGIGLENVKKRLELLYAPDYMLNITDAGKLYCVDLILSL